MPSPRSSGTAAISAGRAAGEQAVGVGQPPVPGSRADAGPPERFRVLGQEPQAQARRDDGGDDLAERMLPLDGAAGGEGIVDMAAGEVAAVTPDCWLLLVPGPQRDPRMALVDEQVPARPQQPGGLPRPP